MTFVSHHVRLVPWSAILVIALSSCRPGASTSLGEFSTPDVASTQEEDATATPDLIPGDVKGEEDTVATQDLTVDLSADLTVDAGNDWTAPDLVVEDQPCNPDCENRLCGSDGCGGSCGTCESDTLCVVDAQSAVCSRKECVPGQMTCVDNRVAICNDEGTELSIVTDCSPQDKVCVDGACVSCEPSCEGVVCGDDGCGGTCGSCAGEESCISGACLIPCASAECAMGVACAWEGTTRGVCGGTIDCDHNLQGAPIQEETNIESLYAGAGVTLSSQGNAVVATNYWELDSDSGNDSCASLEGGQPWRSLVDIRFVVPLGASVQGATHYVSLYIGDSWPGGIAVEFYSPAAPPGTFGVSPFHISTTQSNVTSFISYESPDPIGYVRIRAAADLDFTFDDLTFGAIHVL